MTWCPLFTAFPACHLRSLKGLCYEQGMGDTWQLGMEVQGWGSHTVFLSVSL